MACRGVVHNVRRLQRNGLQLELSESDTVAFYVLFVEMIWVFAIFLRPYQLSSLAIIYCINSLLCLGDVIK